MELEVIMLSEISLSHKEKYHMIFFLVVESWRKTKQNRKSETTVVMTVKMG
jgi:hypothetical protein